MDIYKSILKFCRSHDDLEAELTQWEVRLSNLLESHPELANDTDEESSDYEDSHRLDYQELSDVPSSLPSEGLASWLSVCLYNSSRPFH